MSVLSNDPDELLESSTKFWIMEQLRQELRGLREERDLTQTEVAEKMGEDQVFVSNSETGRRRMDPVDLFAFLSVYGVSIDELLDRLNVEEAIDREYKPKS